MTSSCELKSVWTPYYGGRYEMGSSFHLIFVDALVSLCELGAGQRIVAFEEAHFRVFA